MPLSRKSSPVLLDICDRLRVSPTLGVRTDTAKHVGSLLSAGALSPSERQAALAVLETLVRDVEQDVRHALAAHVAHCATLPPSLARTIADDVEAISVPFIRVSPALDDTDLIAIIAAGGEARQIAIAGRETVSGNVTEALIGTQRAAVVTTLLRNDGAQISERSYHEIMNAFVDHAAVQELMVERAALPLSVIERLIRVVADVLRQRLIVKHALPPEFATKLLEQARERTLMNDAASVPRAFDVELFAHRLKSRGELTPTLLMRALCQGDIHFFEAGMAALCGITLQSSVVLVADRGPLGFKALYEKSALPPEFFRAFRAVLEVLADLRVDGQEGWNPAHVKLILERVTLEYDEACPTDLEYLLSQMSHRMLGRADHQWRR